MNIEIESGVTYITGDGVAEAFVGIVNLVSNSTTPEQLYDELALSASHFGMFFKWGFGSHHFWLHQRLEAGSDVVKKERVLISRF